MRDRFVFVEVSWGGFFELLYAEQDGMAADFCIVRYSLGHGLDLGLVRSVDHRVEIVIPVRLRITEVTVADFGLGGHVTARRFRFGGRSFPHAHAVGGVPRCVVRNAGAEAADGAVGDPCADAIEDEFLQDLGALGDRREWVVRQGQWIA